MTGLGAAPIRRRSSTPTRPGVAPSMRRRCSQGFRGIVQMRRLCRLQAGGPAAGAPGNAVTLAFCWAHCRRRFYEIAKAAGADRQGGAAAHRRRSTRSRAEIRGKSAERAPSGAPGGAASRSSTRSGLARAAARAGSAQVARSPRRSATRSTTGRGYPLPRGRPDRDRHQHGRAFDAADCSQSQECSIRRPRSCPLGSVDIYLSHRTIAARMTTARKFRAVFS